MSMGDINAALCLPAFLERAGSLADEADWSPFRPGVSIRWLYQTHPDGPSAALLRYQPGAGVPLHEHLGYEHILVLQGSQSDERGHYPRGSFVVNPPGSRHAVRSEGGCVVLIIWERGVRIIDPDRP
jgi:anti-sigma factor ChrR (cupin superfamily)